MSHPLRHASALTLRSPRPIDGTEIRAIHAEGLATGHASFRDEAFDWRSFEDAHALALVAEVEGELAGWVGVEAASDRAVFAGVGAVRLYVSAAHSRRGIGRALLRQMIRVSEAAGWWTLSAQAFPENEAAIGLFQGCGFEVLALRRRLGLMAHGPKAREWRDVLLMERRSRAVAR